MVSPGMVLEMNSFNDFLLDIDLIDVNPLGRNYTWYHPNGRAMSRIDRALVSESWSSCWGNISLWVLPRSISDHYPLVLKCGDLDWGHKPFRFNNYWLENRNFKKVVEGVWRGQGGDGWMGVILKNKLKGLKEELRVWSKEVYGNLNLKAEKLIEEIADLDVKGEFGALSSDEVFVRKKKFEEMWSLLRCKDASLFQRSKSRWLKEGDANSKYFHRCVKARADRNSLKAIEVNGVCVESPLEVRKVVVDHFRCHVAEVYWERPTLDGVEFMMLTDDENGDLTAPFSMLEIEDVVKTSDSCKSPGPDGFNFAFFKEFWYLVKHEIRIMFDQFHANEKLPKSFLSFFVTLIPKVNAPVSLNQFRPISLLGSLYKLLSKVLAKRLSKVMNSIISVSQSAFLKGRHLVDGVLIVNEVVDLAKRAKRLCLILKVDFEKAYDSVNWGFLKYMMRRVGMDEKWIRWMKACTFGGNMSILVNGSPTEEINVQRGLKQGDPLAPFLFLLVAEGFNGLMSNAVNRNLFKGFELNRGGMVVSHLQYADDTLCIGEPTVDNLWMLKAILRGFEMASGLKVNFHKSSLIGINVDREFMEVACRFLHCREGVIPFKYLGLPVGANPRKASMWEPMLAQLKNRLHSWGNKYVSLGGRIVLLNSVLNAIPIFYLSFMKIPTKVIRMVIRI